MKYEIELPDDIGQQLAKKAAATGDDVVHLIQIAVGRFVSDEVFLSANGDWSDEGEARRRNLIDKDISGAITSDELVELARLDRLANEHFDRVSPPPIEGARRLYDRLSQNRANNGH